MNVSLVKEEIHEIETELLPRHRKREREAFSKKERDDSYARVLFYECRLEELKKALASQQTDTPVMNIDYDLVATKIVNLLAHHKMTYADATMIFRLTESKLQEISRGNLVRALPI